MRRQPKNKRYHGARALLNRVGFSSTAAIVAEIEDTSTWRDGEDGDGDRWDKSWVPAPSYTFQLANCDRSIAFELDFGSQATLENNLHKIDTIIEVLTKFKAGVIVEHERHMVRKREALRLEG